jgi:hypothetical protein
MSPGPDLVERHHQANDTSRTPQIEHVVMIAGPSCVGKSTLIDALLAGGMADVARKIGMQSGRAYKLFHATESERLEYEECDAVLLHYELTRKEFITLGEKDEALASLSRASRVSFLTLWEAPEEVERRLYVKVRRLIAMELRSLRIRRAWRVLRRFRLRKRFFSDPAQMWELYLQWFDFTATFTQSPHWVLRPSRGSGSLSRLSPPHTAPLWQFAHASEKHSMPEVNGDRHVR